MKYFYSLLIIICLLGLFFYLKDNQTPVWGVFNPAGDFYHEVDNLGPKDEETNYRIKKTKNNLSILIHQGWIGQLHQGL